MAIAEITTTAAAAAAVTSKKKYNILNWRQGTHIIERSENVLLKYIPTK